MDELAKHIERSLKECGFCVVLEDDLERCWPSGRSTVQTERKTFNLSPNHVDGTSLFSIPIQMLWGQYSNLIAEWPHRV